jgi:hypothetical protein
MPLGLSEEEALQVAIERSALIELGQWEGLGVQLHASDNGDVVMPPPPEPAAPAGWGHAVWESPPHAPPAPLDGWGYDKQPQLQALTTASRVPMVP